MSKETSSLETNLPPEQKETPALWEKLVAQLKAGKFDDAGLTLEKMGLSKKLVSLFAVAVAEEAELATVESAGIGMLEKHESLSAKLKYLLGAIAKSVDDAEKINTQIEKVKAEALTAIVAHENGERAKPQRRHLQVWLAELFGEKPIDEIHAGALSSSTCPPKTFAEAMKIGLNVFKLRSWHYLEKPANQQRRVYSTFAPSNPLFQKGTN